MNTIEFSEKMFKREHNKGKMTLGMYAKDSMRRVFILSFYNLKDKTVTIEMVKQDSIVVGKYETIEFEELFKKYQRISKKEYYKWRKI